MNLAGLHDKESVALGVTGTWALDTVALSENPPPRAYDPAYSWIARLNWGYGSTGTLPEPSEYILFASRYVAPYVAGSKNCHRWVIGNEPNLSREWPNNQPIFPHQYALCYKMCRNTIHALPGHENDEVLIAASGPWNNELKYSGNPNGDWIKYFEDVIAIVGDDCDGFSIHSYTHGYSVPLVTLSARMQAPFQSRHYEFRTYQDYLGAIPDSMAHLPVYLTEANGNGPWQAVGLMPAMLNEIDNWNKGNTRKVSAVIFYRYPKFDDFYIDGRQDVINEYKAAVSKGYTSPDRETNAVTNTVHIPAISTGTTPTEPSLPPPRIWDERLTARGVTVETPPVAPGQAFWRVVKAQWYDAEQSQGRHHIYIEAAAGTPFLAKGQGSQTPGATNGKVGFDAANAPMWASEGKNGYSVWIDDGKPSESLKGIGMGAETPSGFNAGIHTSTGVTFQLVTMPQAAPQPTAPTVPVEPTKPPKETPVATGDNWTRSIAFTARWEGGYQNVANDVGNWTGGKVGVGENKGTNWGVSAASYPHLDIRNLTREQAHEIFKRDYWVASGADKLSWPACLIVFDTAILHGVGTAKAWQSEVGTNAFAFAAKRLRVYTKMSNWDYWGKGWVNRTADLLEEAGENK